MKPTIIVLVLGLSGCAAFGGPKVISDRYAKISSVATPAPPVRIEVATDEADPKDGGIAITALSDRGQAALIEQTKGSPPLKLKSSKPPSDFSVTTTGSITRKMVMTLWPEKRLPLGDRIDSIDVKLKVRPEQAETWRISSWTQASDGTTVKVVGKLTDERAQKLTGESGITTGAALTGLKVGGEASHSVTSAFDIDDETPFVASVSGGVTRLRSVAGWRQNLMKGYEIDVVVSTLDDFSDAAMNGEYLVSFSPLRIKDEKNEGQMLPAPAAKVELTETLSFMPKDAWLPICGTAELDYGVRHISNEAGSRTFSESDDEVQPQMGHDEVGFMLAPPPLTPVYGLWVGKRPLAYMNSAGRISDIKFADFADAMAFLTWIKVTKDVTGTLSNGVTFGLPDPKGVRSLTAADLPFVQVGVANLSRMEKAKAALLRGCPGTAR
ncbi:hypothetical protein M9M90_14010 [Phenylobacterium sp. LH3H17]|uniref:hypothetical protein n=1 Tax=Phenylobacterium sp. LH3H17 TaxID=2903901 RepID=UPI0020C9E427|nr:hypothetical protein [Phenylobacterium sp. LH3H17]UTP38326.1 hypothetical protein M9M90_14010 [Phenylobacterium sp. LH3H17]